MNETCENCLFGDKFKPRLDEIARYGEEVMGCDRYGYEGYTQRTATCEAFRAFDGEHRQHSPAKDD